MALRTVGRGGGSAASWLLESQGSTPIKGGHFIESQEDLSFHTWLRTPLKKRTKTGADVMEKVRPTLSPHQMPSLRQRGNSAPRGSTERDPVLSQMSHQGQIAREGTDEENN